MNCGLDFKVVNFNDGVPEEERVENFSPYFEYEIEEGYFRFTEVELASWQTSFTLPVIGGDRLSIIRNSKSLSEYPLEILIGGYEANEGTLREVNEDGSLRPEESSLVSQYFSIAHASHFLDAKLLRHGDRIVIDAVHDRDPIEKKRDDFLKTLQVETRRSIPMRKSSCVFAFK